MRKEKTGDCIKGDHVGVRDNGEDKWNGEDEGCEEKMSLTKTKKKGKVCMETKGVRTDRE